MHLLEVFLFFFFKSKTSPAILLEVWNFVVCSRTGMLNSAHLLYLVSLQEITGFSEVGFECFWLQLCLDGCTKLGIHLFFGGNLWVQKTVRHAYTSVWFNFQKALTTGWVELYLLSVIYIWALLVRNAMDYKSRSFLHWVMRALEDLKRHIKFT